MRVAGESPNTAYSLSKIFTSRSKVSESKSGPTSIRPPLLNTTFKAQAGRRFPSLFFPANSTVTNRIAHRCAEFAPSPCLPVLKAPPFEVALQGAGRSAKL
jgi:hypothetical protein